MRKPWPDSAFARSVQIEELKARGCTFDRDVGELSTEWCGYLPDGTKVLASSSKEGDVRQFELLAQRMVINAMFEKLGLSLTRLSGA